MLEEARGDGDWPELMKMLAGAVGVLESIQSGLVARGGRFLGGNREEERAFNPAWSQRG